MVDERQCNAMAFATVMLVAVLVGLGLGENVEAPSKECSVTDNKTCAVAVSTTTVKNPLLAKTTTAGTVRYEVPGNNTDAGSAPKEIVVIDVTVDPVTGNRTNGTVAGSGNGTVVTAKTIVVTANNGTTVNATTTETVNVSRPTPPPVTVNIGVEVVRFVPHKYCYCDILYGSCDTNCCCDTDCTSYDLKTFTLCSDQAMPSQIKQKSILFDSSLFYIVVDNVPSDYFYPERDAIESEQHVARLLRNRDVYTWHDENIGRFPRADSTRYNYDLNYKSSQWMFTVMNSDVNNSSEIKAFSLKNNAFDSLCAVEEPVEYLKSKDTSCQTFVSNLKDVCNNGSSLSFKHYIGKNGLFKVVQPIYNAAHKTEKIGLATVRAAVHHRCASADGSPYDCPPQPDAAYAGAVCLRAVSSVQYRVTHNGTGGVLAVDVDVRHRDLPDAGRAIYLGQRFGVRFVRAADAEPAFGRSGKPGYAIGNPVLVMAATTVTGTTTTTTTTTTTKTMDDKEAAPKRHGRRPRPMDMPEPDGRGMCGAAGSRRPIGFMVNAEVRCRVRVRWRRRRRPEESATIAELCHGIQNEVMAALGEHDGTLVSSLGDPDVAKWTPAVVVKPPPPSQSQPSDDPCPAIVDGVHVRVLWAHVGAFDRPDATVLGVLVNYTASGLIAVNHSGTAAEVPVRATAVFVDVTRPPVRTFAEPPTYEFRLPEDFYYPFWSSDGPAVAPGVTATTAGSAAARSSAVPSLLSAIVVSYCAAR